MDISAFNLADFATLQNLFTTMGADTQINLDADSFIILQDIDAATLTMDDFIL